MTQQTYHQSCNEIIKSLKWSIVEFKICESYLALLRILGFEGPGLWLKGPGHGLKILGSTTSLVFYACHMSSLHFEVSEIRFFVDKRFIERVRSVDSISDALI